MSTIIRYRRTASSASFKSSPEGFLATAFAMRSSQRSLRSWFSFARSLARTHRSTAYARPVLLAVLLAAPLIAPAYAIGPVRLGEHRASVARALGPGRVVGQPTTELGNFVVVRYTRAGLTVTYSAGGDEPATSI